MDQLKKKSFLLTVVCGYIFLITDRPWESVSYLYGMRIQFVYAIFMIVVAGVTGRLFIKKARTNFWVFGLLVIHFLFAPFSFSSAASMSQGFEYFKIVLLYTLMVSAVDDDADLRVLLRAYVLSVVFFSLHSLWEYHNGKFVYRMGIVRMVGVGEVSSSPNGFGATLVLSIPLAYVLARCDLNKWIRRVSWGHLLVLVPVCVVLTGSRSAFVAMIFCVLGYFLSMGGWKKYLTVCLAVLAMAGGWHLMPADKQERIESIWNKDVGPANAHESAQGRIEGMIISMRMFSENPLTGVGAGKENYLGYRSAMGESAFQAHVLYGEVLSEFGLVGGFLFVGLVAAIWRWNLFVRRLIPPHARGDQQFCRCFAGAMIMVLLLLLILGLAGHNFHRNIWLFLAAWTSNLVDISTRYSDGFFVDSKRTTG